MPRPANESAADPGRRCKVLVLACGALAKEITEINQANHWNAFDIHCIPAKYHNYPEKIPGLVRDNLRRFKSEYEKIFVAFGDCGTGGLLDKVLDEEAVERLPGAHCYAFFAGLKQFDDLHEEEIGTFYFTDFFVRHFENIMIKPYGLGNPVIKQMMFNNYKRVVYLAQNPTAELKQKARQHAAYLGLDYVYKYTGYGELETKLSQLVEVQCG